jgi:hypothetical protein
MCEVSADLTVARDLAQAFRQLMKDHAVAALPA